MLWYTVNMSLIYFCLNNSIMLDKTNLNPSNTLVKNLEIKKKTNFILNHSLIQL